MQFMDASEQLEMLIESAKESRRLIVDQQRQISALEKVVRTSQPILVAFAFGRVHDDDKERLEQMCAFSELDKPKVTEPDDPLQEKARVFDLGK